MDKKSLAIIIAVVVVVAIILYLLYKYLKTTYTTTTTTSTTTTSTTTTTPTTTPPTSTSSTQTSTSSTSPTSTSSTSSSTTTTYTVQNTCSQSLSFEVLYKLPGGAYNAVVYGLNPGQSITVTINQNYVVSIFFITQSLQDIPANISGNTITPAYCPSS